MKLNCDLGESFGRWTLGLDEQAMPLLDQANIACGYHAGDPQVMYRTLKLAQQHNVMIGAHPAYPDLSGFGRRSMKCSDDELYALMHYQMAALDGMAQTLGTRVAYVKPHGALYNDMMKDPAILHVIMRAVSDYHQPLSLMIQATNQIEQHREQAQTLGLTLWAEAFADRCYMDDGSLMPRAHPDAVLNQQQTLKQVEQLLKTGQVTTHSGKLIALHPDSLCVHGDNPQAIEMLTAIRAQIS